MWEISAQLLLFRSPLFQIYSHATQNVFSLKPLIYVLVDPAGRVNRHHVGALVYLNRDLPGPIIFVNAFCPLQHQLAHLFASQVLVHVNRQPLPRKLEKRFFIAEWAHDGRAR